MVKNRVMCCQWWVLCSIAVLAACNRVKATVIGPSWDAIAKRYQDVPRPEARALLIERVKKGSVGHWNTWKGGTGMPPLEKRVAAEHIERLVDYILSLHQQVD